MASSSRSSSIPAADERSASRRASTRALLQQLGLHLEPGQPTILQTGDGQRIVIGGDDDDIEQTSQSDDAPQPSTSAAASASKRPNNDDEPSDHDEGDDDDDDDDEEESAEQSTSTAAAASTDRANERAAIESKLARIMPLFWEDMLRQAQQSSPEERPTLPFNRVRKVMKLEEDVGMISQVAPVLLAKACEVLIGELATRTVIETQAKRRRKILKQDVVSGASRAEHLDFLIDILPRDSDLITRPLPPPNAEEILEQIYQEQLRLESETSSPKKRRRGGDVVDDEAAPSKTTSVILDVARDPESESERIHLDPDRLNKIRQFVKKNLGIQLASAPTAAPSSVKASGSAPAAGSRRGRDTAAVVEVNGSLFDRSQPAASMPNKSQQSASSKRRR